MKKLFLIILTLATAVFVSVGYVNTKPKDIVDPIKSKISRMTLDEKIGQLVIVGLDGLNVNSNSINMIKKYKVGGFIVYKNNVSNANQLLSLTNTLKLYNAKNSTPLFISVDQEGGIVDRMPSSLRRFPTNSVIGQKNNKSFSYNIGNTIGQEIKEFGFNIDFAPVLDINSNPKNPVIGSRSFGNNPKVVSDLGVQTMKGIQKAGVIPVIKHFPGHGDTLVDSHVGLPIVYNNLSRLNQFEFIPFREAIKNKADVVMVAHILLPKIDSKDPSSFSKIIITDILRNKLEFHGVVITDDMTMGAIKKNYNLANAAVKSINAGSDIILVAHNYSDQILVINALKKAVASKEISEQRINESVYRILRLKYKYNLNNNRIKSVNVNKINSKISSILR